MDWLLPLREVLLFAVDAFPLMLAGLILLIAARWLFFWTTPLASDKEIVDHQNGAVGVVLAGYMLSVGLALTGALYGRGQGVVWETALEMLAQGAVVVVLLLLSIWINDKVILRSFSVVQEIREDRNLGAAFCVAGSCLASGLVLNGALSGYSLDFWSGLRDIGLYWLVGQALLALAGWVYHRLARYDVHHVIEYDDNAAAGLGFGGFLLALGIVVRASLVGAGKAPLVAELLSTLCMGLLGLLLLAAINSLTTRFVLPSANYEEEVEMKRNLAAAAVIVSMTLAVALVIAVPLQRRDVSSPASAPTGTSMEAADNPTGK